ncbi:hypothetical protein JYT31_02350 [Beggiatoa alba]|nr:hypothetical protein [Beggiatoa alba]
MSQTKFVSLPVLLVNRSKSLLLSIIFLHTLALLSLTTSLYFHLSVNIVLAVLISCSFYYYIDYYKNPNTLKSITYRKDGLWVLNYPSKSLLATLETDCMITEWLIILRFKTGKLKIKTLPLFFDMLPKQSFKQLRVVLPFILKKDL